MGRRPAIRSAFRPTLPGFARGYSAHLGRRPCRSEPVAPAASTTARRRRRQRAFSKNLPNVQATAEVTGGSVNNLKLIGAGQERAGLHHGRCRALDALGGRGQVQERQAVAAGAARGLYQNRIHVVTVEGTGIQHMADLKGKRVSTGSPGNATEVMAFRVIEAAGLDKDKDLKRERLGVAEIRQRRRVDSKIDAFFGSAAFQPPR